MCKTAASNSFRCLYELTTIIYLTVTFYYFFQGRLALRKTKCLSLEELIRFLLSVIICPVLEQILSEGTDVATMHSHPAITLTSLGYTEALDSHQLSGSAVL